MATAMPAENVAVHLAEEEGAMEMKALVPPATEREPESEDAVGGPPSSPSSVAVLRAEKVEGHHDAAPRVEDECDVEMECDEDAFAASDDDEADDGGEERAAFPFAPSPSSSAGTTPGRDVLDAAPVREYPDEYAKYQVPVKEAAKLSSLALSPTWGGKRKRGADAPTAADFVVANALSPEGRVIVNGIDMGKPLPVATKRKGSSDFLRKGQWTPTEERLARLLIEAFEEGYLPIYTGIRLRGYLAVQLQCDPMRVSKKLCAGTIDGKKIPKNYGQKKFRLRKKMLWDRDEAGRILATLERLTKELWCETGIAPPPYLTLSTTRNADDEAPESTPAADRAQSSPVKKLSPPANKSKKQRTGVVFPIIYLNLSKKLTKQDSSTAATSAQNGGGAAALQYDSVLRQFGIDAPYVQNADGSIHVVGYRSHASDSDASSTSSSSEGHAVKVDGESLQAAYELLNLHQHCSSPSSSSSSRSSTPTETHSAVADEKHHIQTQHPPQEQARQDNTPQARAVAVLAEKQPSGVVPIRPAPAKPTILRQHAPTVAS